MKNMNVFKTNSWYSMSRAPTFTIKGSKFISTIVTVSGGVVTRFPFEDKFSSEIFVQPSDDIFIGGIDDQLFLVPGGSTLILDFNYPGELYMKSGVDTSVTIAIITWEEP